MADTDPTIPTEKPPTPVQEPSNPPSVKEPPAEETPQHRLDPTRYGDWELNGKCVDF